jgi:hypothetical protein
MATHTWFGANSGDWFSSTLGSGDTAPQPGDAVALNGGTVTLSGGEETVPVDGEDILLDGPGPAETVLQAATWGHSTTIDSSAGPVTLITDGASGDSGTIIASAAVSSFTIKATNGAFVLLNGGSIAVSNGDDLVLTGQFDTETGITVAAGSTLTNDGIDGEFGGITDVLSGAAGRPDPQLPDRQYNRSVSTAATSAFSSAARGLLKIDNGSSLIASLTMQGPPTGALATAPDGSAGTLITYPDSPIRASVEVDTAHVAVGANVVHQTPTTAAGAPVIGTGITIGIISDSFNATPNGIADPADTAARRRPRPTRPPSIFGWIPTHPASRTKAWRWRNGSTRSPPARRSTATPRKAASRASQTGPPSLSMTGHFPRNDFIGSPVPSIPRSRMPSPSGSAISLPRATRAMHTSKARGSRPRIPAVSSTTPPPARAPVRCTVTRCCRTSMPSVRRTG